MRTGLSSLRRGELQSAAQQAARLLAQGLPQNLYRHHWPLHACHQAPPAAVHRCQLRRDHSSHIQGRNAKQTGHLLIAAGLRTNTARLLAMVGKETYVGNGWIPVTNFALTEAQAAAVCINSTLGAPATHEFTCQDSQHPSYSAKLGASFKQSNLKDRRICSILTTCWKRTRRMEVPLYRDGECDVRRLWDEAMAEAMDWDCGSGPIVPAVAPGTPGLAMDSAPTLRASEGQRTARSACTA